LSFLEYYYGADIPFVEIFNNHPKVYVPLIGLKINIPMNYGVIMMWLVMSFYAIYFYSFKGFLKVFIEEQMFESQSLKRLRFFLKLNIIPLVYITIIFISLLINGMPFHLEDDHFIVFAHLIIAFLIYLYLDVLKKGKLIQEENDLTI
jgi:hypothetical protein